VNYCHTIESILEGLIIIYLQHLQRLENEQTSHLNKIHWQDIDLDLVGVLQLAYCATAIVSCFIKIRCTDKVCL